MRYFDVGGLLVRVQDTGEGGKIEPGDKMESLQDKEWVPYYQMSRIFEDGQPLTSGQLRAILNEKG